MAEIDEIKNAAAKAKEVVQDIREKVNPVNIAYQLQKQLIKEDDDGNPVFNTEANLEEAYETAAGAFRKHLFEMLGWGDHNADWVNNTDERTGLSIGGMIDQNFGVPLKELAGLVSGFQQAGYGFVLEGAGEGMLKAINSYGGQQAQLETAKVMQSIGTDPAYQSAGQQFTKEVLGDDIDAENIIGKSLTDLVAKAMDKYEG